jgi:hypothetical protein
MAHLGTIFDRIVCASSSSDDQRDLMDAKGKHCLRCPVEDGKGFVVQSVTAKLEVFVPLVQLETRASRTEGAI